jgi:deoxyribose-phosphate aldolase
LPAVDAVGLEARAAKLGTRSLKGDTKKRLIDVAISMVDLTTLEGTDTPGRVRSLCAKAVHPNALDLTTPSVAAVCVYPDMVGHAVEALAGTSVRVASVAGAFPSGRSSLAVKLLDVSDALSAGAVEIDTVIDRGAFLEGRYDKVFEDITAIKELCGRAHLKVILETGDLVTYDNIRRASWLAMLAGADFIKTSTGKVAVNATLPTALVMLEAVRDFHEETGVRVGVKAAGGVRSTKDALKYLVLVNETTGADWLTPNLWRFGASALLNDLVLQRDKQASGHYGRGDNYSND